MPISDANLAAGELVAIDSSASGGSGVVRTTEAYQKGAVGVISTKPGLLLGADAPTSKPVALAGRVPVDVTLEGGAIRIGDYLTASSAPGKAMRANERSRGGLIGIALSAYDGTPVPARDWGDGIAHEQGDQVLMLVQHGAGGQAGLDEMRAETDSEIDGLEEENQDIQARAAVLGEELHALEMSLCKSGGIRTDLCSGE
jgi:hypothetical protein